MTDRNTQDHRSGWRVPVLRRALSGCRCPWVLWVVRTRLWLRWWPGQAVVGKATISFQVASRVSISRR